MAKNAITASITHVCRECAGNHTVTNCHIFDIVGSVAPIAYTGPRPQILSNNLSSATGDSAILTKDSEKQIAKNGVTPVAIPWQIFISSPQGLAPKPNGGWRRGHHLSFPQGL